MYADELEKPIDERHQALAAPPKTTFLKVSHAFRFPYDLELARYVGCTTDE